MEQDSKINLKKVLVIDDDNWIQRVASIFLHNLGYEPIVELNAVEGLIEAINNPPDLIILDYLMPEINGDSALKIIKHVKYSSNVPVILISGNFDLEAVKAMKAAGGNLFLSKPFNQQKLEEKINIALGIPQKAGFVEPKLETFLL